MNINEAKKNLRAHLHLLPESAQVAADFLMKKFDETFRELKLLKRNAAIQSKVEDLPHEIWRDVVGYEGLYQNSLFGRAKSFYNGKVRILSNVLDGTGYVMWRLYKNKKPKMRKGHIVTALTFIPNPDNKPQINHFDGDKINNCVWNLKWSTQSENI